MHSTPLAGPAGPKHAPIDWDAFSALQGRFAKRTDTFGSRCLEEAEDRLFQGGSYKHSGTKLAKCLERDCRKSTRLRRSQELWLGDNSEHTACGAEIAGTPIELLQDDLLWAVKTLSRFVQTLPARTRLALAHEADGSSKKHSAAALGVAERQYRNICRASFVVFRRNVAVMESLVILRGAGAIGLELFYATFRAAGAREGLAA